MVEIFTRTGSLEIFLIGEGMSRGGRSDRVNQIRTEPEINLVAENVKGLVYVG